MFFMMKYQLGEYLLFLTKWNVAGSIDGRTYSEHKHSHFCDSEKIETRTIRLIFELTPTI